MSQNLLDTHTFIWFIEGDKNLSVVARQAIEANDANNFVSIASLWEIAIKISLGKLELNTSFNQVNRQLVENGFNLLPITIEDTLTNKLTLLTGDESFSPYGVKRSW